MDTRDKSLDWGYKSALGMIATTPMGDHDSVTDGDHVQAKLEGWEIDLPSYKKGFNQFVHKYRLFSDMDTAFCMGKNDDNPSY